MLLQAQLSPPNTGRGLEQLRCSAGISTRRLGACLVLGSSVPGGTAAESGVVVAQQQGPAPSSAPHHGARRDRGSIPGVPAAPPLPLPPLIDTFLLPRLFWSVTMAIPCLNGVLVNLFTIPIITFSNPG